MPRTTVSIWPKLTRKAGICRVAARARSLARMALANTMAAISCAPVSTV